MAKSPNAAGDGPDDDWSWAGCSDSFHFGSSVSRQFLDSQEDGASSTSFVNLHNNEAGRLVGWYSWLCWFCFKSYLGPLKTWPSLFFSGCQKDPAEGVPMPRSQWVLRDPDMLAKVVRISRNRKPSQKKVQEGKKVRTISKKIGARRKMFKYARLHKISGFIVFFPVKSEGRFGCIRSESTLKGVSMI